MPTENRLSDLLSEFRFTRQTPTLAEAGETVAAPGFSLGSIVDAPVSRSVTRRKALTTAADEQARAFREARQHGMGGFAGLPELSADEAARIMESLQRFAR